MFLSSSDLKVQVEDVLGRYFEKMYNLLSNGENLDEIANVLTIGQAYTRLPTSFDWDEIVYKCMETFRSNMYSGKIRNFSYSSGHTFYSHIVHFYSENTGYYKKFLRQYDESIYVHLGEYIEALLKKGKPVHSQDFDVISGAAGIVEFLLEYPNDFSITLAHKLSRYLVDLTVCGSFKAYPIPGWYVPSDDRLSKRDERFLDGHINYGMAHGITGVLASLVKLGEYGVNKPRVDEAIRVILNELDKVRYESQQGIVYYPGMMDVNDYVKKDYWKDDNHRMSWCYGSISILYTLYRTYEYLNMPMKCREVLNEITQIAKSGNSIWQLTSPIICHGFAGTALIFKLLYDKTQDGALKDASLELIRNIVEAYNDTNQYGFKDVRYQFLGNSIEKIEEDKNTFLEGGCGIISALLCFLGEKEITASLLLLK